LADAHARLCRDQRNETDEALRRQLEIVFSVVFSLELAINVFGNFWRRFVANRFGVEG